MQHLMEQLSAILWGVPLLVLMAVTGLYFTIKSGFFQFRFFGHIIDQTFGTLFREKDDEKAHGTMTSFEALSVAVGGSVGVANTL